MKKSEQATGAGVGVGVGAGVRVWDLPTRLFHWVLAALIGFSWWSAEEHHTDWHMWSGFAVLTLLLFRLLWGFFGSSTARFANFVRGPRTVAGHLRDVRGWSGVGHSPIGALGVLTLLIMVAVQVGTGPDVGKTDARAEIWQKPEDFAAKADSFNKAGMAFQAAARGTDVAAMKAAHGDLGKSCKACHDLYREEE